MALTTESELGDKARNFWLKAISAIEMHNYDYAISLLQMVVKEHPDFLEGRKALRRAAIRRKKGAKKKFMTLGGGGIALMRVQSQAKKDPDGALESIEKVLESDPYNVSANHCLYKIAMRKNMPEVAAFALETVKQGHPGNTKSMHQLAMHYMEQDEPERAAQIYSDIVKQDPTDMDAIKGSKDATARASMRKGKWDAGGMSSLLKDEEEAKQLEAASRSGMTREQIQSQLDPLLAKYAENQNDLANVRKIAGLYEKLEDWASAESFYQWAFHLSNGDNALERKAGLMKERRIDIEIKAFRAELEENPGASDIEEKREALKTLMSERSSMLIAEAKKRVERNPTDPQLRFELGQHLFHAGEYTEAIKHLQRARNNPHIRTRAILTLGKCYEAKNMLDLAKGQLEDALSELHGMDDTKKEVLYNLGLVHEKMNNQAEYLECLKRIYEVDYSYRDVSKRVESSYAG